MRKPPPISTSSPRLTTTAFPAACVARTSRTAAAPLLTTSASSAPADRASRRPTGERRSLRRPDTRSISRLDARARRDTASGARPRLVCRSTPVALTTGRSSARSTASARRRADSGSPAAIAARAASTSSGAGSPTSPIERASASTAGGGGAAATTCSRRFTSTGPFALDGAEHHYRVRRRSARADSERRECGVSVRSAAPGDGDVLALGRVPRGGEVGHAPGLLGPVRARRRRRRASTRTRSRPRRAARRRPGRSGIAPRRRAGAATRHSAGWRDRPSPVAAAARGATR